MSSRELLSLAGKSASEEVVQEDVEKGRAVCVLENKVDCTEEVDLFDDLRRVQVADKRGYEAQVGDVDERAALFDLDGNLSCVLIK